MISERRHGHALQRSLTAVLTPCKPIADIHCRMTRAYLRSSDSGDIGPSGATVWQSISHVQAAVAEAKMMPNAGFAEPNGIVYRSKYRGGL